MVVFEVVFGKLPEDLWSISFQTNLIACNTISRYVVRTKKIDKFLANYEYNLHYFSTASVKFFLRVYLINGYIIELKDSLKPAIK